MLDAISDFWKPSRKSSEEEVKTVDLSALKLGASVGFGFMPQTLLSGKRRSVSGINTYQFGEETLISYVLSEGADQSVSMIIADSGTEAYIALSRRLQFAERMRMFENAELLALIENADQKRLNVRDADSEWRQWLVPQYKKEIHGLKGRIARGDYRTFNTLPAEAEAQEFTYYLLTSPNNEFAVEVEMYGDSRIELYATVYRRLSDIGEIREINSNEPTLPGILSKPERPEPKLVVKDELRTLPLINPPVEEKQQPLFPMQEKKPEPKLEPKVEPQAVKEHVESKPLPVAELDAKKIVEPEKVPESMEAAKTPAVDNVFSIVNPKPAMDKVLGSFPTTAPVAKNPIAEKPVQEKQSTPEPERKSMSFATFNPQPANASLKQEIKTMNGQAQDYENDTIECELRAANKIIEEAIRNEMRMSDVIRRVIGLPLAGQEAVQIPVLLSEDDYKLLAIRYGIAPADKNAIKARIIEEVNDFSGAKH